MKTWTISYSYDRKIRERNLRDLARHNVLRIMIGGVLLWGIYNDEMVYFMPLLYDGLYMGYRGRVGA